MTRDVLFDKMLLVLGGIAQLGEQSNGKATRNRKDTALKVNNPETQ